MNKSLKNKSLKSVLLRNTWIALFLWTMLLLAFATRSIETLKNATYQMVIKEAETHLQLDESFRKWTASHGGVYIPVDSVTRPSPYLKDLKNRDIISLSGDTLTLINPARALRLMSEYCKSENGVGGHITSLKLLRPQNAPDQWERKALLAFESGKLQVDEVTRLNGEPVYRLMKALYVQKSCLKCHKQQGYKVGDVRGGVSVTVPIAEYLIQIHKVERNKEIFYLIVWLIGAIGILFSTRAINKKNIEIERA